MLGGDGQHVAVELGEKGEERVEGVEFGGGDVAKVHGVEHQEHVFASKREETHLIERWSDDELDDVEVVHLLLLVVHHRIAGEVRSLVSRQEASRGGRQERHLLYV